MSRIDFHHMTDRLRASARREIALQAFEEIDRESLAEMTDKALAEWQSGFDPDTPQAILAEHEWQRRLTAKQVGAMRFAAWLSIAGVVIGAFLGFGLSYFSTSIADEKAKKAIASECSSSTSAQAQRPVEKQKPSPTVGVELQQPPHATKEK